LAEHIIEHEVGIAAPDFTLKDQDGKDIKLSDQKGKRVLLSFHPLAWTLVCTNQMQSIEDNCTVFESLKTLPLGMSVDPVPSKKAWADHHGWKKIRLPSDFWPHGEVASLFNIFRQKNGFSERANIIIDENGVITFFKTYPLSQLPDINEVIDILKRM
jgi:peroxiredoxin